MEDKEGFLDKNKYYIFLLIAIILVGMLWWFGGNILWNQFGGENHANLRGDAYGALNTLFSGLAFAGIIISILMQSEELRLQRKELKETRNEFKIQSEVFKKDNFEKGFYNLLELLNTSLDNFQIAQPFASNDNKGNEGLRELLKKGYFMQSNRTTLGMKENKLSSKMLESYLQLPEIGPNTIKIYIKTFNLIISSIFKKIHNKNEIPYYVAILKSRMIDIELDLIALQSNLIVNEELKKYYKYFLEYEGASSK